MSGNSSPYNTEAVTLCAGRRKSNQLFAKYRNFSALCPGELLGGQFHFVIKISFTFTQILLSGMPDFDVTP